MKHFPIFLAVAGRRIVVSGGGEAAIAKLRLLLKTDRRVSVQEVLSAWLPRVSIPGTVSLKGNRLLTG